MNSLLKINLVSALLCLFFILNVNFSNADESKKNLSIGSTSYLSYESSLKDGDFANGRFKINRSYITIKKNLLDHLSFGITIDAHQDETGYMKAILKYIYANFNFNDWAFITSPNIEFGIVHTPWLDFEEHTNYYRMQGTMFMERSKLFNSADFGFTVCGLIGGKIDEDYQKNVNKKYPGKYGSFAFGIYNGGGYHSLENTENKTFKSRLTIRPLPQIIPGLQLSYFGIFGKGNKSYGLDSIPEWLNHAFMLSYEHKYFTLTGQFVTGKGNQKGDFVFDTYKASEISGYSTFLEIKPDDNWKGIIRYDNFDKNINLDNDLEQRIIVGIGYDFGDHNILILDYDKTIFEDRNTDNIDLIKLTMQIIFH